MLKRILFSVCLMLFVHTVSNSEIPVDRKTGKAEYTEVVNVDSSKTKTDLYTTSREWVAVAFKSAQHVLQMDDKDAGKLICKGNLSSIGCGAVLPKCNDRIDFTLTIETKDGRYRYTFSDLQHVSCYGVRQSGGDIGNQVPACGHARLLRRCWDKTRTAADVRILELIATLKTAMVQKNQDDNW